MPLNCIRSFGDSLLSRFASTVLQLLKGTAAASGARMAVVAAACHCLLSVAALDAQIRRADSVAAREAAKTAIRAFRDSASHVSDSRNGLASDARYVCPENISMSGSCRVDTWGSIAGAGPAGMRMTELLYLQRMLVQLSDASLLSPNDQWIIAMRAHFLALSGDLPRTREVIHSGCAEPEWWCEALLGWISHLQKRFLDAQHHFRTASVLMPSDVRCQWENLSLLMPSVAMSDKYLASPCSERREFNETVWWLSDPLFMEPGNDRRTEHYARWVNLELTRSEGDVVFGVRMPMQERGYFPQAALRRSVSWCALAAPGASGRCGRLVKIGREPNYVRSFMPFAVVDAGVFSSGILDSAFDGRVPRDLLSARTNPTVRDSMLIMPGAFDGGYPPLRTEQHQPLDSWYFTIPDAQTALMRRGAQAALYVAFDPRVDSLLATGSLTVGVATTRSPEDSIQVHRVQHDGAGPVRMVLPITVDSLIVSLEARLPGVAFARHRFALVPSIEKAPPATSVSEILMFAAADGALPGSGNEALHAMLPRTRITSGEPLGLYWELYDRKPGERPTFELSVSKLGDGGVFRAITQALGLRARSGSVSSLWQDAEITNDRISTNASLSHALIVDTRSLEAGRYEIAITTTIGGATPTRVAKIIEVRSR